MTPTRIDAPDRPWLIGAKQNLRSAPDSFGAAFFEAMLRHGDTPYSLTRALDRPKGDHTSIRGWVMGAKEPHNQLQLAIVGQIERHYDLKPDSLLARLRLPAYVRSAIETFGLGNMPVSEVHWHIPRDFLARPQEERAEILNWIRENIGRGVTRYGKHQSEACRALGLSLPRSESDIKRGATNPRPLRCPLAPQHILNDWWDFVYFKTVEYLPPSEFRRGMWSDATIYMCSRRLGLFFGRLSDPSGPFQVPLERLSFALLLIPSILDAVIRNQIATRGLITTTDIVFLQCVNAMVHPRFGWLRQRPKIAESLVQIDGLLTDDEVGLVQTDWSGACDRARNYCASRILELQRRAEVHRNPAQAVEAVLSCDSPLLLYKSIPDQILSAHKMATDAIEAAKLLQGYLIFRILMHTGLRRKNLTRLLVAPKGSRARDMGDLARLQRGEVRFGNGAWQVVVPRQTFKNAHSSFFSGADFMQTLPDSEGLNELIDRWLDQDRLLLLGGETDPQTFFISAAGIGTRPGAFNEGMFYDHFRHLVVMYGIWNPYTRRGALAGIRPHGPHTVRMILATHIYKITGSAELAGYAIQDSPQTVRKFYARYAPGHKSEIAARLVRDVWSPTMGPGGVAESLTK